MEEKRSTKPLVTVSVITYNSSATVIATLDSIAKQTYDNIELIISDDASIDNTVELCHAWVRQHEMRFAKAFVLTVEKNTGVAGNCNRAIDHIRGEYYKCIAGDDLLLEDCIETNVKYIIDKLQIDVLFSKCYLFTEGKKGIQYTDSLPDEAGKEMLSLPVEQQKIVLYYGLFIPTPTLFIRSQLFNRFRYNEKYPGFEDYPFVISLTENNVRLYYLDEYTVLYRISDSVSHPSSVLDNRRMWHSHRKYFDDNIYDKLVNDHPRIFKYKMARFMLADFRIFVLGNKNTKINHLFSFIYRKLLGTSLVMNGSDAVKYAKDYYK